MLEVEVRKFKETDIDGGTVIDGFPTVGLVSTIAADYLIGALEMDQISALESDRFPPTSMVYANKPKFPARIYASKQHKLAVFFAEFTPSPELYRPLAKTILSWAREQGAQLIVSPEGLPIQEPNGEQKEPRVWGVGSTDRAASRLEAANIPPLDIGIIAGVSGILLNEGRWSGFDVVSLMAEAHPEFPDALAAAKILEAIDILLDEIDLDLSPLIEKARELEKKLKLLRHQSQPVIEPEPTFGMYR
jgi:uncharacterized protein